MRAMFELIMHLPTKRAYLFQWPGRVTNVPKVTEPTLLAATRAGRMAELVRAMGPKMMPKTIEGDRQAILLDEEAGLRMLLLVDALGGKQSPSDTLLDHITQMTGAQAAYWAKELRSESGGARARRALSLMAS